jgi:nucleotide-binding universal stress UspA family protein
VRARSRSSTSNDPDASRPAAFAPLDAAAGKGHACGKLPGRWTVAGVTAAGLTMYKHILISTDGSEIAQKGVDHGLSLAKTLGAKVTVVTVTEPFPFYASVPGGWVPLPADVSGYVEAQREFATKLLDRVSEAAEKMGVEATLLHVPEARPAEAIVETAKNEGCSLIVMSSHGRRGLGRLLLGSQTSEVLVHSPVPVLVVR